MYYILQIIIYIIIFFIYPGQIGAVISLYSIRFSLPI